MFDGTPDEISRLVQPGRVHRRVYTDSDVFALEIDRIFGRAWLFVGHESQVPSPGDFITTELGRQPAGRFTATIDEVPPGQYFLWVAGQGCPAGSINFKVRPGFEVTTEMVAG